MTRRPDTPPERPELICLDCEWIGDPDEILDCCPLCGSDNLTES